MKIKVKDFILFDIIVFLLVFGLLVSGIGETFCRYVLGHEETISFEVKGFGSFYIESDNTWHIDESNGVYKTNIVVSNATDDAMSTTNHGFKFRWFTTSKSDVTLLVHEKNGKESRYIGKLKNDDGIYAEYRFYDENGNEINMELEGNKLSSRELSIEVSDIYDGFVAKAVILDASYDVDMNHSWLYKNIKELNVISNTLSDNEKLIYLIDGNIDISLSSNQNHNSKVLASSDDSSLTATINGSNNLDFNLVANETKIVNLDIARYVAQEVVEINEEELLNEEITDDETTEEVIEPVSHIRNGLVNVKWQILNNNGNVIKEMSANFKLKDELHYNDIPIVACSVNSATFSKDSFIDIALNSDIDTLVNLGYPTFPQGTRYSLNNGESWIVLTKEEMIDVELFGGIDQKILIDLSHTNIEWNDQDIELKVYFGNQEMHNILLSKRAESIILLEISDIKTGVINHNAIDFTLNTNQVDIIIEHKQYGLYSMIENKDIYFDIINEGFNYSLTKKADLAIPQGNYRIRVRQNTTNKEVIISFFVSGE